MALAASLFISAFHTGSEKPEDIERGTIDIGMVVTDLQRSLEFYTEVLGMKQTGQLNLTEEFGSNSGLTGGTPLEITILKLKEEEQATAYKLMSFGNEAGHARPNHIQDDTGIQYVTIYVTTLEPYLKRIDSNGIELLGETPISLGDGRRFALIQDPDGTFIELIGP